MSRVWSPSRVFLHWHIVKFEGKKKCGYYCRLRNQSHVLPRTPKRFKTACKIPNLLTWVGIYFVIGHQSYPHTAATCSNSSEFSL